jgi:large subunit ribosomal protein L30
MKKLRITLTKSVIGQHYNIKRTAQALGLTRTNAVIEQLDTPTIRGMVFKVKHLVTVEEVEA